MFHQKLRLIGYIRTINADVSSDEQKRIISNFCDGEHFHLIGFTGTDEELPSYGFQEALEALDTGLAEGIIALDLERFVVHHADRLFDIRPLIEHILRSGKQLITIQDGVETQTAVGQKTVQSLLSQWSDRTGLLEIGSQSP